MSSYVDFEITTSPDELRQLAIDSLQAAIEGWLPSEANLDVLAIYAVAWIAGEVRDVAAQMPPAAFSAMGKQLYGIPQNPAVAARTAFTFTTYDALGHDVYAGTNVGVLAPDGSSYAFTTDGDLAIAAGQTQGTITATALVAEAAPNGIAPTADNALLLDALAFNADVVLALAPSGGADPESDDAYRARLAGQLQLIGPRPITPPDFALYAMSYPGVGRAWAVDLLDSTGAPPAAPVPNQERCVTVYVVDVNGQPLPVGAVGQPGTMADLEAELNALREVNFKAFVRAPLTTPVTVKYSLVVVAGYDPTDVKTRVGEGLAAFFSPLTWGIPLGQTGPTWVTQTTVHYFDIAAAIDNVEGVNYLTLLQLNGGTVDVALPDASHLPALTIDPASTVTSP